MSLRFHTLPTLPRAVKPGCRELLCLLVIAVMVSPSASGMCPTACICATDIVSCTNKNLSKVPGNLFRLIKRLDLSYNRIGLLDADWIPVSFVKLSTLILRHNNITSISTGSFSTTPNLKCLDLSSNRLKSVKSAINLDSKSYDKTTQNVKEPGRYTFEDAQEHIYKLMKSDSYPRFIRSSAYQELLQAKRKGKTLTSKRLTSLVQSY